MIDLALVPLRQTVTDPEHAWRNLARHFVRHSLALLVAADVARYGHALVASLEELIQHAVMPRYHVATSQDTAVARRDCLNVVFVEHVADTTADRVGRRAFQPPI